MKIYLLSPTNVPQNPCLFPTFKNTFFSKGHSFVDRIEDSDTIFFDLHTRLSYYLQSDIDYALKYGKQIISFCEWDRGNMSTDEWPNPLTGQQQAIFNHIRNDNVDAVHFCRLLDKTKAYPENVYPYEKPVSNEWFLLTKDELFQRPIDICWIANYSPTRALIRDAIINDGRFRAYILLGEPQIPFDEWISLHGRAKFFISAGAGGYTDQKVQALFSVAGIIRERNNQWLTNDFTHLDNCLRIDCPPTKEDLDTIYEIVNDKDRLYEIYLSGYNFMKTYYTEEYMANYILEKLAKHGIE